MTATATLVAPRAAKTPRRPAGTSRFSSVVVGFIALVLIALMFTEKRDASANAPMNLATTS